MKYIRNNYDKPIKYLKDMSKGELIQRCKDLVNEIDELSESHYGEIIRIKAKAFDHIVKED